MIINGYKEGILKGMPFLQYFIIPGRSLKAPSYHIPSLLIYMAAQKQDTAT